MKQAGFESLAAVSNSAHKDFFSRNSGLLSDDDQLVLAQACIAIAGAGGDGGLLAERLVRMGVGKIILADPEVFEPSNINRQFAANGTSLGKNKAEAVARELLLINPDLDVRVYNTGITAGNIAEIVSLADVVVDEIEYAMPWLSVMMQQEAREQGKYVFMGANIGWGASIFCFHPEGLSFEEHFEYNEAQGTINPLKYLKGVPGYFSESVVHQILSGIIPMPALSASVSLVAALMTTEIVLFLTAKRQPLLMPDFLCIDLHDRSLSIT